ECIEAFKTLKMKLTQDPILVAPDWDLPFEIMCDASDFAVRVVLGQRGVCTARKLSTSLKLATMDPWGGIMVQISLSKRSLMPVSSGPLFTKIPTSCLKTATHASFKEKFHNVMRCLKIPSKFMRSLTSGALILWGRSRLQEGTNIYSWQSITYRNGLKQKHSPPMMPELFANFSNLFSPDSVPLVQS
ncbi:reverse transcriptase domain-containing protein, partial [Tanacetum coccineum]